MTNMKSPQRTLKMMMLMMMPLMMMNLQKVIDTLICEGKGGGNDTVDTDEHPEGPKNLLLFCLGPEYSLVNISKERL